MPGMADRDALQVFQALDVAALLLVAGAGAGAAHGVGGGDDIGVGRVERLVQVVGADGVGDDLGLAEPPRVVGPDHGVVPSMAWVSDLPMSCISAARRAIFTSRRSSAAIMPHRNATSTACFHWFWL